MQKTPQQNTCNMWPLCKIVQWTQYLQQERNLGTVTDPGAVTCGGRHTFHCTVTLFSLWYSFLLKKCVGITFENKQKNVKQLAVLTTILTTI